MEKGDFVRGSKDYLQWSPIEGEQIRQCLEKLMSKLEIVSC